MTRSLRTRPNARDVHGVCETCQANVTSDDSGERGLVMTTKSDFTEEEWVRVRRAPFVAGMAISMADPGGPIELSQRDVSVAEVGDESA